jgi:hypothetical protein
MRRFHDFSLHSLLLKSLFISSFEAFLGDVFWMHRVVCAAVPCFRSLHSFLLKSLFNSSFEAFLGDAFWMHRVLCAAVLSFLFVAQSFAELIEFVFYLF